MYGNHLGNNNPFPAEPGMTIRVCATTTIVALVPQVIYTATPTVAVAHRTPHRLT